MRATHENVKLIRAAKGINKTFVAKKLGLSLQGYIHVENGTVNMTTERLRSIAQILGEEVNIFFDDQLTDSVISNLESIGQYPAKEDESCSRSEPGTTTQKPETQP